jgi:hypothetical protein
VNLLDLFAKMLLGAFILIYGSMGMAIIFGWMAPTVMRLVRNKIPTPGPQSPYAHKPGRSGRSD